MQWIPPLVKTDLCSMPFHHALCIGRPTYNEFPCSIDSRWVQSTTTWTAHQRKERGQSTDSLNCISVRLPHTGYISLSKVSVSLKTTFSTLLSSSRFQQPLPFHILCAGDSNNPTAFVFLHLCSFIKMQHVST